MDIARVLRLSSNSVTLLFINVQEVKMMEISNRKLKEKFIQKSLKKKDMKFERYIFGLFLAMEVIMSFTFLGYVHLPPISVTISYVPVVIIACVLGITESTIAGLVLGIGSLYKASSFYVMPADMIFSPFQSGFPLGSVLLSVGTRMLFGFLIGVLFALVKKGKMQWLWKGIIALTAPKLHALLVFGAMGLLFPEYGFGIRSALNTEKREFFISFLCTFVTLLIDRLYNSEKVKQLKEAVNESEKNPRWSSKFSGIVCVVGFFIFCMAVFSMIYFADRMEYMLGVHEVQVTKTVRQDILHLQVQFLVAMLALHFILMVIILLIYNYMKYEEYKGQMDHLTGVMGRRQFLQYCTRSMEKKPGCTGWFLFLDVDYFKQINDTMGYSAGDETLWKVANCLHMEFSDFGAVGRVGGDEFAVFIEKEMKKDELEKKLDQFLLDISKIWNELTVSSSIGAYQFMFPQKIKDILVKTDSALYKAKENGRACYVIIDK